MIDDGTNHKMPNVLSRRNLCVSIYEILFSLHLDADAKLRLIEFHKLYQIIPQLNGHSGTIETHMESCFNECEQEEEEEEEEKKINGWALERLDSAKIYNHALWHMQFIHFTAICIFSL
jgi:hypothetical protein